MEDLALQFVSGLLKAMFLFLLASGLSLIFGVSRVLNITHGAFYALGACLVYAATRGGGLAGGSIGLGRTFCVRSRTYFGAHLL